MDLSPATLWWIATGVAIAAELATGTFYLLMIAVGLAAGAIAAQLGAGSAAQVLAAALMAGGATALLHVRRSRQAPAAPAATNHDVNLDIGERVAVAAWAADRTARVKYRGSTWSARLAAGAPAAAGEHIVSGVEGNWLVLSPA